MVDVVAFDVGGETLPVLFERAPDDQSQGYTVVEISTSVGEMVASKAGVTLQVAADSLRPAAKAIIDSFAGVIDGVKEIQLEFGIKLTGEAGAIIARTTAEGHCTVTVKWARD